MAAAKRQAGPKFTLTAAAGHFSAVSVERASYRGHDPGQLGEQQLPIAVPW
jgi:hypothetical protein